jgi:hypothetical protein
VIGETYNEGVIAMIHKTWCKTPKQTIMPKETLPKEIIMSATFIIFFGIFFMGMKHGLKQIQL